MERNWETLREILFLVEEQRPDRVLGPADFESARGHEIFSHVLLLREAGLIQASVANRLDAGAGNFRIFRLTWAGQELLDSIRNGEIWELTKSTFLHQEVGMSIELVKSVALANARSLLLDGMPAN